MASRLIIVLLLMTKCLASEPLRQATPPRPHMTVKESRLLSLTCSVPPVKGLGCVNRLSILFTPQQRSQNTLTLASAVSNTDTSTDVSLVGVATGRVVLKEPQKSFMSIVFPLTEADYGRYVCFIDYDDCLLAMGNYSLDVVVDATTLGHVQRTPDKPQYFKTSVESTHEVTVTWTRKQGSDFELMTLKRSILGTNGAESNLTSLFKIPTLTPMQNVHVLLHCSNMESASSQCRCRTAADSTNYTITVYASYPPCDHGVKYISEVKDSHGSQTVFASVLSKETAAARTPERGPVVGEGASGSVTTDSSATIEGTQVWYSLTWTLLVIALVVLAVLLVFICAYRRGIFRLDPSIQTGTDSSTSCNTLCCVKLLRRLFCGQEKATPENDKLISKNPDVKDGGGDTIMLRGSNSEKVGSKHVLAKEKIKKVNSHTEIEVLGDEEESDIGVKDLRQGGKLVELEAGEAAWDRGRHMAAVDTTNQTMTDLELKKVLTIRK